MPNPKYKIGDIVIVAGTWGHPASPQTTDQYLMAMIVGACIQSGVWQYRIESPYDEIRVLDFEEKDIIQIA